MGKGRTVLVNIVVLVVTIIVVVAVVDAVAYFLLGMRGARSGSEDVIQFSPMLGHFQRPLSHTRYYPRRGRDGHDVDINSFGFCDMERSAEKTRPRIVLIGDSTTEAWEVDPEQRPQVVLEEMLDDRFEVLNLGIRAYGTDQSLILLERIGMAFQPDIVIHTFCINDIRDNAKHRGKPYFEIDREDTSRIAVAGYPVSFPGTSGRRTVDPVWKYSLVYRTFGLAAKRLRIAESAAVGEQPLPLSEHFELTPYKSVYNEEDRERWRVTRRIVAAMRDVAEAGGARFMAVEDLHLPEIDPEAALELSAPYASEATFDFGKVTRLFEGFTQSAGIPFVSLARVALEQKLDPAALMPPGDTVHLSAEGIRFWATEVGREMERRGWLD